MTISSKTRYGLKIMLFLAENKNRTQCSLDDVSHELRVSDRYLQQVATTLRLKGYIASIKGAGGGFRLLREPSEINMGRLIRDLEGDLHIAEAPPDSAPVERVLQKEVYDTVFSDVTAFLDSMTLESYLNKVKNVYYAEEGESMENNGEFA
jgi:Rrf2 family protein